MRNGLHLAKVDRVGDMEICNQIHLHPRDGLAPFGPHGDVGGFRMLFEDSLEQIRVQTAAETFVRGDENDELLAFSAILKQRVALIQ